MMEVKPNVFDELVFHLIHDGSELRPNSELRALLVDQIDENLLSINLLHLIDVFLSELH